MNHRKLYEQCKSLSLLVVEDTPLLRENLIEGVGSFFEVAISATDGQDGEEKYQQYYQDHQKYIDVVMTDIRMPRRDGLWLAKEIKAHNPTQIIIVISAHKESEFLIEFINLGISHYLCKPMKIEEIFSTIHEISYDLLERSNNEQSTKVSHKITLDNHFVWDHKKSLLLKDGTESKLTLYSLIAMELLAKNVDKICTIEEFIGYFYTKGYEIDAHNVRSTIFRLRQKIPKKSIVSLYGVGYRLLQERD